MIDEVLVEIGPTHLSHFETNSASISLHTSIAHLMTLRITTPFAPEKSGSM